jgi:hypothetical protein
LRKARRPRKSALDAARLPRDDGVALALWAKSQRSVRIAS